MRALQRDGYRLHWREDGAPDGAAVLFINSLGTDLRVWDPLLPLLPQGLRILRFDKPGHGLSDGYPGDYSMDALIDDAGAVLDAADADPTVLVGLSIGGMIAQGLAARRPKQVRAFALLDTGHKIGTAEMWNERIAVVERDGVEPLADAIMERWFSADFRARAPEVALWRNMVTRTTPGGYAGCSKAIRDTDFTEIAAKLRQPAVCVVGTADGSTPPALVKELSELVMQAEYHEIDGVGHIPCVEAPDRLARILSPFLTAHAVA
ncbi:MAG: 3-oxoadipate enol-lactonase [Pseudomonadota bacterium]